MARAREDLKELGFGPILHEAEHEVWSDDHGYDIEIHYGHKEPLDDWADELDGDKDDLVNVCLQIIAAFENFKRITRTEDSWG